MAKVLSASSRLRTGLYKTSTTLFFTPSKLFEAQMTEIFDEVWPTVTAIKMLRWQVKGYFEEYCIDNNARLSSKFVEKEDITNRPNLYRTCIEDTWEDIEYRIAKNLLTNIFACYEGWAENILTLLKRNPRTESINLQSPTTTPRNHQSILGDMIAGGNADLVDAYYDEYRTKCKLHNPVHLDNWFHYYRYFKECRNAIIHQGGQTTQRVVDAYANIQPLTAADLDVIELPQTFSTSLGEPIKLSLRGVVGFSQLTIRIVSTLDIEFIKAKHADKYFGKRILEEVKGRQTISASPDKKNLQIKSLSRKGAFKAPSDKEAAYRVMKAQNVTT